MKNALHGHDRQESKDLLYSIVTINEASYHWGKHRRTIYFAIDRGDILARSSKHGWMIEVKSLIAYWGEPKIPFENVYELNFPLARY